MNSKEKGKRGEREFADALEGFGLRARRGQQFAGGGDSPDVVCDDLPGVHFEVKRCQKTALYNWLDQAKRDAGNKLPIVVHRKNRKQWIAILDIADIIDLLRVGNGTDELTSVQKD